MNCKLLMIVLYFSLISLKVFSQNPSSDLAKLSSQELTDSIKAKPSNSDFYYYRGLLNSNENRLDVAVADYSTTIKLNPKSVNAYLKRGKIYYTQKKDGLAIADFSSAIELNPASINTYYNRGVCYSNLKLYELAVKDFTVYIISNQENYKIYQMRGQNYQYLKQDSLAIIDFTTAIGLNSKDESVYNDRASSYFNRYEKKLAKEEYYKVLNINPKNSNAYTGLLKICFSDRKLLSSTYSYNQMYKVMGKEMIPGAIEREAEFTQRTMEILDKLIVSNPDIVDGYQTRASIYNILEKYDLAIKDCNVAIKLNPKYAYAFSERAKANFKLKNYDLSVDDYTMAIKIKNIGLYHNLRGHVYKEVGKRELALKDFLEAVRLEPTEKTFKEDLEKFTKK